MTRVAVHARGYKPVLVRLRRMPVAQPKPSGLQATHLFLQNIANPNERSR
jgi:hypothetical protein